MKVNIYLANSELTLLGFPFPILENNPVLRFQYFFCNKALLMLDDIILKVNSGLEVSIYLKTDLYSLFPHFTEALNQIVKRCICLFVEIFNIFFVGSFFRS